MATKIYFPNGKLKKAYFGTSKIKKIYIGENIVWQDVVPVDKPTQTSVVKTYNGSEQTNGYSVPDGVIKTGDSKGTNAGAYVATYTPAEGYEWSDGTTTPVSVTLTINRASVGAKPATTVSKTYSGSVQNNGYTTPTGVNMTGNNSGTNAGSYSATYTPDSNHKWSDNTTSAVTITMTIAKMSLTIPSVSGGGTYSGGSFTATVSNFNSTRETQSGTVTAINVGTYTVTWSLKDTANTQWSDGTITNKSGSWSITRASVGAKPTTAVSKTYTGSEQTNGYTTPSGVTMTGSNKGTNASTYTATYTPDSNHKWSDNSTSAVTVTMTIARASVGSKPTTAVSKDYNGSSQTNGYTKPTGVNMTGNASGTNGGTYSATYTPDSNHKWSDGSTGAVTVVLTINYAWTKWNVSITATETITPYVVGYGTTYKDYDRTFTYAYANARYCTLNSATGKYELTDSVGMPEWKTLSDTTWQQVANTNAYDYFVGLHTAAEGNTENAFDTVYEAVGGGGKLTMSSIKTRIAFVNSNDERTNTFKKKTVTRSYGKGTTNLGTVRSTNINAYPQNGTTDNTNWYVKNW